MKRVVFAFAMLAFILTGCESNIDHPIAGHTYSNFGGGSIGSVSVYIHFAANGSFDIDYMTKTYSGYEHNKYNHFKWEVDGNEITINHDNSTYWKSSVRGSFYKRGTYNTSDQSVTLEGTKYKFAY